MISKKYLIDNINLADDPIFDLKFLVIDKNDPLNNMINLYAGLVNKNVYFRTKSKLNGVPYLTRISKNFEEEFGKTDPHKFSKLYNQYLNVNSKWGAIHQHIKSWIKKDRIPFPIIRLLSIVNEDDQILIEFMKEMEYITDRSGQSKFKPPFLLREIINPKRLYDIGSSMGDGGLFKHQQIISDGAIGGKDIYLTEQYLKTLKQLKIQIWGFNPSSLNIKRGNGINKNMFRLTVSNKWFVNYLRFVYDLPVGDKIKQKLQVPSIINLIPKDKKYESLSYLYRGLIDSDGFYHPGSSMSGLYTASEVLKNQFIDFLKFHNIKHSIGKEEVKILSDDYLKFVKTVGSSHPRKLNIIMKRLEISPKRYIFKGVNEKMLDKEEKFNYVHYSFGYKNKVNFPEKPSEELLLLIKHLIPQKDNNKCLITREGLGMKKGEIDKLVTTLEAYFNCKVKVNPSTGAYLIHSAELTRFLRTFFVYEKMWQPLNKKEFLEFQKNMIKFLEGDNERKADFH